MLKHAFLGMLLIAGVNYAKHKWLKGRASMAYFSDAPTFQFVPQQVARAIVAELDSLGDKALILPVITNHV